MEQKIFEKIKFFLTYQDVKSDKISMKTTIQSLKKGTDEIEDFISIYGNHYKIDFAGFRYEDYFMGDISFSQLFKNLFYQLFYPSKLKEQNDKLPVTIEHLIKVAESGKWFKP